MRKVIIDDESQQSPVNTPDISGMFNNPMGMMMGGMMSNMMPPIENKPIEVAETVEFPQEVSTDVAVVEEETDDSYKTIKTVTPYNVSINTNNGKKVASLFFLCRDINDKLITLVRNYIIDNDEDELAFKSLPFTEFEEDFVSRKIVCKELNLYLDSYIIDMKFSTLDGYDKDAEPKLEFTGVNISTKEKQKFLIDADKYACITFIDSYIFDNVDCEHDLALATVAGSKTEDNKAQFYIIDKLESIVSMSKAVVEPEAKGIKKLFKKKSPDSTNIALILKASKFVSKDEKDTKCILMTFDTGTYFDESKFRGKTINNIQDSYFEDADQYVATLTIMNTRLYGVDKEYMLIRGKNKDKDLKLFLFDNTIKEELVHLINEY